MGEEIIITAIVISYVLGIVTTDYTQFILNKYIKNKILLIYAYILASSIFLLALYGLYTTICVLIKIIINIY